MKPRKFDDLPESCKYCMFITGLINDQCRCEWADDYFEWEKMDPRFEGELIICIRFKIGYSKDIAEYERISKEN